MPDPDLGLAGAGVLDRVGERLGDREVARGLDRRAEPSGQDDVGLGAQRRVQGQRPDRLAQAAVGQHRGVDAADQVAQLGESLGRGFPGLGHQRDRGLRAGRDQVLGGPQAHAQGDQPGLRPVVQVPLHPPQLGRGAVHRVGPGMGQLLHPPGQVGVRFAPQQDACVRDDRARHQPEPQGQHQASLEAGHGGPGRVADQYGAESQRVVIRDERRRGPGQGERDPVEPQRYQAGRGQIRRRGLLALGHVRHVQHGLRGQRVMPDGGAGGGRGDRNLARGTPGAERRDHRLQPFALGDRHRGHRQEQQAPPWLAPEQQLDQAGVPAHRPPEQPQAKDQEHIGLRQHELGPVRAGARQHQAVQLLAGVAALVGPDQQQAVQPERDQHDRHQPRGLPWQQDQHQPGAQHRDQGGPVINPVQPEQADGQGQQGEAPAHLPKTPPRSHRPRAGGLHLAHAEPGASRGVRRDEDRPLHHAGSCRAAVGWPPIALHDGGNGARHATGRRPPLR